MKWFFLSGENIVKLLLTTLIVVNIFPLIVVFLWTLALVLIFFLYRKNKVFYKDNFAIDSELCLAPVNGKVLSIARKEGGNGAEMVKVRVALGWFNPAGLYLPFESSVESLERFKGKSLWRFRREPKFTKRLNHYNLNLLNKKGQKAQFTLFKCPLGLSPRLFVEPGDRGKTLACFGYLPLGGSLTVKLPVSAKVLVSPGDKLKAGETAVAGFSS